MLYVCLRKCKFLHFIHLKSSPLALCTAAWSLETLNSHNVSPKNLASETYYDSEGLKRKTILQQSGGVCLRQLLRSINWSSTFLYQIWWNIRCNWNKRFRQGSYKLGHSVAKQKTCANMKWVSDRTEKKARWLTHRIVTWRLVSYRCWGPIWCFTHNLLLGIKTWSWLITTPQLWEQVKQRK